MPGCASCGCRLEIVGNQVGRKDTCPNCGADIHACRMCRHYHPHVAKQCKEPFADVPEDKESANFCEYFQVGEGGVQAQQARDAMLEAAEALFRKK